MKTKIGALMVIALFVLSIFPAVFAENDAERVEPSSVEKKMVDAELTELFTTGEKSQKPRMIRTTSLKKTEVYQKASPVINAKEVTSIGMVEKVGTFNKIQSQLSSNIAESFEDATEEIGSSPNHVTLYVANGITVEVIYRHGVFAGEVEIDTDVAPESAWSHDGNKMWGRYTSPFWAGVYMNGDKPKTLFAGTYKIFKFKFIDRYYGRWMVQGWDGQTLNGWAIFR